MSKWIAGLALAAATIVAVPGGAQTVGGRGTGNSSPFTANVAVRYEEVYNSSAFPAAKTFDTISYGAYNNATKLAGATYSFYFSPTTYSSTTLTNNLNTNVTGTETLFGTYTVPNNGAVMSTFSFTGTPYTYDPASGNLLLDVRVTNPTGGGSGFLLADLNTTTIARASINSAGNVNLGADALQTTFNTVATPVSAAPEPGTWLMMIVGFGVVGGALRRRQRMGGMGFARAAFA